jgi:tetratricopeptide (TPR) repeat protein
MLIKSFSPARLVHYRQVLEAGKRPSDGFFDRMQTMPRPASKGLKPRTARMSGHVVLAALLFPLAAAAQDPPQPPPEEFSQEFPQELPGQPPELVTWLEARIEFDALVSREQYTDALPVGEQMVSLTERELGAQHADTARAYAALADVQRRLERYDDAELNYLRSIELWRDVSGPFSEPLIAPMVGLGDSYHQAGDYGSAVSAYNEARTVSRRVHGLLSEQQIPILDRISASLRLANLTTEATEHQVAALELVERTHGPSSPQFVDALHKYGRWLRDIGRYNDERAQYSRVLRLARDGGDQGTFQTVRALRETANSFRSQRIPDQQGANALIRAMDIVREQTDPNPLQFALLLRDLGDWQTAFGRSSADSGDEHYLRAWQLLEFVEDGDRLRSEWFSGTVFVLLEPVNQRGISYEPGSVPGHVTVQFTVDPRGRAQDVQSIASVPAGLKDEDVIRSIGRSRFRPYMENGEVRTSPPRALEFTFRYLPNASG